MVLLIPFSEVGSSAPGWLIPPVFIYYPSTPYDILGEIIWHVANFPLMSWTFPLHVLRHSQRTGVRWVPFWAIIYQFLTSFKTHLTLIKELSVIKAFQMCWQRHCFILVQVACCAFNILFTSTLDADTTLPLPVYARQDYRWGFPKEYFSHLGLFAFALYSPYTKCIWKASRACFTSY